MKHKKSGHFWQNFEKLFLGIFGKKKLEIRKGKLEGKRVRNSSPKKKKIITEENFWKKIIAIFCIVFLLAPLYVKPPSSSAAPGEEEKNLVVILVDSEIYSGNFLDGDDLSPEIYEYARDVQASLPDTKSLLLPVSKSESPGRIFTALENLYLEGQKKNGTLFRLSGIVLIGEVPFSILRTEYGDMASVFPYTDFEDPAFVWNESQGVFEKNFGSSSLQAEVFHGVIRAPETFEKSQTDWLREYFEKNHQFHSGELEMPEKVLLFSDFVSEYRSQHPLNRRMYDAAESIFQEDLAFYRYNFHLYSDVNALYENFMNEEMNYDALPPEFQKEVGKLQETAKNFPIPDSLAREQILQLLPRFVGVVSGFMSDASGIIEGTGRWSMEEDTGDTIPEMISKTDILSREYLRELTLFLEEKTTKFVEEEWQQPVMIATHVYVSDDDNSSEKKDVYYHGQLAKTLESAEECFLDRGSQVENPRKFGDSSQLTEMNHLWNISESDDPSVYKDKCHEFGKCCALFSSESEQCAPKKATRDVFDMKGGKISYELQSSTFLKCTEVNIPGYQNYSGSNGLQEGFDFTQEIPSLVLHNEPRPETISKAIENMVSAAIPADEDRYVTFQGPGFNVVRVDFPNFFDLVDSCSDVGVMSSSTSCSFGTGGQASSLDATLSDDEIFSELESYLSQQEANIRGEILISNIQSYVGFTLADEKGIDWVGSRLYPDMEEEEYEAIMQNVRKEILFALEKKYGKEEEISLISRDISGDNRNGKYWKSFFDQGGAYSDFSSIIQKFTRKNGIASFIKKGGGKVIWINTVNPREDDEPRELMFSVVEIPKEGFLFGKDQEFLDQYGGEALTFFLRWRNLNADEKHKIILEKFYSEDSPEYLGGRSQYELAAFRAKGTSAEMWWGGEEMTYLRGDDPEWDMALSSSLDDLQISDEEVIDECTGKPFSEGVSVLEWMPAFMCWLEKTMNTPVNIEMTNECSEGDTIEWADFLEDDHQEYFQPGPGVPGEGAYISITSPNGSQIPVDNETLLEISFHRQDGPLVRGGIPFTLEPFGGIEILKDPIGGDSVSLFEDSAYGGKYFLPVRIFTADDAGFRIRAEGFPEEIFSLTPIIGGKLEIIPVAVQKDKDVSLRTFRIVAIDSAGETMTDFYGEAYASLSDSLGAEILTPTISLQNGVGKVQVHFKNALATTLMVSSEGVKAAAMTISLGNDNQEKAKRLLIRSVPKALGMGEREEVEVIALDARGKKVSLPEGTQLMATAVTQDLVTIGDAENGRYILKGGDLPGVVRLIAQAPDVDSDAVSLPVVLKISREDLRKFQPNSLVSSYFGSDFANFFEDGDPLANSALFSGNQQAVLSAVHDGYFSDPEVMVFRDGSFRSYNSNIISTFSSYNPLKLRLFKEQQGVSLAEYSISFPRSTEFFMGGAYDTPGREGIYFSSEVEDGSFIGKKLQEEIIPSPSLSREGESVQGSSLDKGDLKTGMEFLYQGKRVFYVSSTGEVEVYDSRFSLLPVSDAEELVMEILFLDEKVLGSLLYRGADIRLLSASENGLEFFPVPDNTDGSKGNGHTKQYIERHKNRIADFARANPNVGEEANEPDWYDGRVAALVGLLWCSDGEMDGENIKFPRAQCPQGKQSLFPEGNVLERIKPYVRPCCVVSGAPGDDSDTVKIFPCQLQPN